MPNQLFELLVGYYTILFLIYGAYKDFKYREVENRVWGLMILSAIPINFIRFFLYFGQPEFLISIISIVIGVGFSFLIWYFGLFGGADAKAFMCTSLLCPIFPFLELTSPTAFFLATLLPFPLTQMMNTYLLVIPLPLLIFVWNIVFYFKEKEKFKEPEGGYKKIFAMFIGYPTTLERVKKLPPWHYGFLEKKIDEQKWEFDFTVGLGDEEEDLAKRKEIISQCEEENKETIWVQRSIPLLVPMVCGFFLSLHLGNIIMNFFLLLS
ncbi:MAG: prepilin peptidase [Promethearchaeota archaeon]